MSREAVSCEVFVSLAYLLEVRFPSKPSSSLFSSFNCRGFRMVFACACQQRCLFSTADSVSSEAAIVRSELNLRNYCGDYGRYSPHGEVSVPVRFARLGFGFTDKYVQAGKKNGRKLNSRFTWRRSRPQAAGLKYREELGVPAPKASPSGFPLQVRARSSLAGFPVQSLTRCFVVPPRKAASIQCCELFHSILHSAMVFLARISGTHDAPRMEDERRTTALCGNG